MVMSQLHLTKINLAHQQSLSFQCSFLGHFRQLFFFLWFVKISTGIFSF